MRVGQEGGQLPIQTISRKTHLVTLRKLERGEYESGEGCEGHELRGVKTSPVEGVSAAK